VEEKDENKNRELIKQIRQWRIQSRCRGGRIGIEE
jgi:hypothetical protein